MPSLAPGMPRRPTITHATALTAIADQLSRTRRAQQTIGKARNVVAGFFCLSMSEQPSASALFRGATDGGRSGQPLERKPARCATIKLCKRGFVPPANQSAEIVQVLAAQRATGIFSTPLIVYYLVDGLQTWPTGVLNPHPGGSERAYYLTSNVIFTWVR